jgi:hypothetical protein
MKSRCNIVDITSCSRVHFCFEYRIDFSKNVKILQNSQKMSKYFRILQKCQNTSEFSKNVKRLQNSQKMSKYFRILKRFLFNLLHTFLFLLLFLRIIKMADKLQVSPEDEEICSYHISSVKITHLLIHI